VPDESVLEERLAVLGSRNIGGNSGQFALNTNLRRRI